MTTTVYLSSLPNLIVKIRARNRQVKFIDKATTEKETQTSQSYLEYVPRGGYTDVSSTDMKHGTDQNVDTDCDVSDTLPGETENIKCSEAWETARRKNPGRTNRKLAYLQDHDTECNANLLPNT